MTSALLVWEYFLISRRFNQFKIHRLLLISVRSFLPEVCFEAADDKISEFQFSFYTFYSQLHALRQEKRGALASGAWTGRG